VAIGKSPTLAEVESWTILRTEVGSTVHGIGLDGQEDRDEMGICIEPPEQVIGLRDFRQKVHRTQPDGVPSGPGDLDLVIYSLRKYCRLALSGNPTVLLPLFTTGKAIVKRTLSGIALQALAPAFYSRRAGWAFYHYLEAQSDRLQGKRGGMGVNRRELVARLGYDSKFAGHAVRLGHQGIDYMQTGRIPVPMPEHQRDRILAIRRGEVPLREIIQEIEELKHVLVDEMSAPAIPEKPDSERVEKFLVEEYLAHWVEQCIH
jgi:hypothetical protein